MDQKLKGYVVRNAENKRRFDSNQRDDRVQQPPTKRQDVGRSYTVGSNEKKGYGPSWCTTRLALEIFRSSTKSMHYSIECMWHTSVDISKDNC
nr:hypothetical protein [Tanacetum cinerariifolium]